MSTAAGLQFERLTFAVEGPIAHITLDHPPLNVIDLPMMTELASALAALASQPQVSVIILRGAGRCFSAGVDIVAHETEKVREMLEKFHQVIRAVISAEKVTIAAVHGHCLGGGAELAMVCDLVYTTEDAQWGFPEIQLGCFPPVAATVLSVLVDQKRAAELILTGRILSGEQAAGLGLATASVAGDGLTAKAEQTAKRLAELSPLSLSLSKKAMYVWQASHFDKGLAQAEKIYLSELIKSEDAQEGIRAFLEKRTPRWTGR
jgi:cyclohexa-1,5-dienecarbonyl-CoA hydratase